MTATPTRPRPRSGGSGKRRSSRSNLGVVLVGVGVLALAALIAVLSAAEQPTGSDLLAFGDVQVDGEPLARYPGPTGADPAAGTVAPEVSGEDFYGRDVEIIPDGRPKLLVFLAHWCPHCQNELPVVTDWLADGGLPAGVDLIAIAAGTSNVQPNFPPGPWFEREGYTGRVVVDDERQTVATAFGLSGYPYWVFLDADHAVVSRASGAIGREEIARVAAGLAAGTSPTDVTPGPSSDAD